MWLWTTGHCPLSCLLTVQSFFPLYPIIGEKSPGRARLWGHLWSTEIEGNLPFSIWQHSAHHLLLDWDLCFKAHNFVFVIAESFFYVNSIFLPRKRFQNVDWVVVPLIITSIISNSKPNASLATMFPGYSVWPAIAQIFIWYITCKLQMEALIVSCYSLALTLIEYIIDHLPFKRRLTSSLPHFLGIIFKYLIF